MASWRLANSLVGLRNEVNTLAPNRSKVSDGTIGDPSHASRCSRHNPNNFGVVCALDLTNDPVNGCPIHEIARQVAKVPHPELTYIISNGQIASRSDGFRWRAYLGVNPHTKHAHFAVGGGTECEPMPPYDSFTPWNVAPVPPTPTPTPPPGDGSPTKEQIMALPTLKEGASGQYVRNMQGLLISHGNTITVDGAFGPRTKQILTDWQRRTGALTADGICGPNTWTWLTGVT